MQILCTILCLCIYVHLYTLLGRDQLVVYSVKSVFGIFSVYEKDRSTAFILTSHFIFSFKEYQTGRMLCLSCKKVHLTCFYKKKNIQKVIKNYFFHTQFLSIQLHTLRHIDQSRDYR